MTLEEQIMSGIKEAMRAKDSGKLNALRAVKSAILLAKTEKGKSRELSRQDELMLLRKLVKQRNEAAAIYKEQNRQDLYEKEIAEAKLIDTYLPPPPDREELKSMLEEIIRDTGARSVKDMGKVMSVATKKLAGSADGSTISAIVRELLS